MKFPSLTGAPVFFRTYSRKLNGTLELETPEETIARSLTGTDSEILTEEERQLSLEYGLKLYSLPSGRRLWFGGTENSKKPENVPGLYNCNSLDPRTLGLDVFRLCFDHLMLGCGVGVVVEREAIAALPAINNLIEVQIARPIPQRKEWESAIKKENTFILSISGSHYQIIIGDSRKGWIDAYMGLLEIAIKPKQSHPITVEFFFNFVRPKGTPIKGFGGTANPSMLPQLFIKIAKILNKAFLRKLTSVEVCLLLDEPASVVVSGNVRRSAGIRQGSAEDSGFGQAKLYLWREDENGNWSIDPERDALRMANHTRVFHHKPMEAECIEAVQQQYYSGEGAIQYAPEAIARANADILTDNQLKHNFLRYLDVYGAEGCRNWLKSRHPEMSDQEINHRLNRYALNPCAEIIGSNFFCNLSEIHLNRLALESEAVIEEAFRVGAINACRQLTQKFQHPQLQYSREIDPIVGISFTGLFDFFVVKFGADYLRWWSKDRCSSFISNNPDAPQYNLAVFFRDQERIWLTKFRLWAQKYVWDFCDRHGLKRPNRYTTVQPSGTKSLLTGASPGWHPPKATRYIRRITFRKNDPVALACIDYGYNVIPSQSDKDENGHLLDDPYDFRCNEWLIEIPVKVAWAELADEVNFCPSKISALAQFDFAMGVQNYYSTHNTSATIELRETEIKPLGKRIFQAIKKDEGYVSFALLSRFDDHQAFPRLPFEPISEDTYRDRLNRITATEEYFDQRVQYHLRTQEFDYHGPAPCDSDKCLIG
jgi:ribonucleotide reductase class II